MVLPVSFALDAQTALERLLAACTQEPACSRRHPSLAADLDRLFAAAAGGIEITVTHPFTGQREPLRLDRAALAGLLRAPLYAPPLAAVLPTALASASQGDFAALLALSTALSGPTSEDFAEVMHFAVVCAEDMPRVDELGIAAARRTRFGIEFIGLYRSACRLLPHALVPAAFYDPPQSDAPVLILSGGADPATPPRHGEAVASRLKNTRHLIAPSLGHGVSAQGCAADLITRFVRQASFDGIDGTCLQRLPAPVFLQMPDGR
jgi:pimeloyl-ACP methyl ester carboxylesterase